MFTPASATIARYTGQLHPQQGFECGFKSGFKCGFECCWLASTFRAFLTSSIAWGRLPGVDAEPRPFALSPLPCPVALVRWGAAADILAGKRTGQAAWAKRLYKKTNLLPAACALNTVLAFDAHAHILVVHIRKVEIQCMHTQRPRPRGTERAI